VVSRLLGRFPSPHSSQILLSYPPFGARSNHKEFVAKRHAASRQSLFDGEAELNRTHTKVTYSGSDTITYYLYEIVCDDVVYSLELEHLKNSRGSGFTVIDFSLPEDVEIPGE